MSGWMAGAVVVGGLGGAYLSSQGSQNAANTQAQAAQNASNTQLGMFNQDQNNLAPYMQAGPSALAGLQGMAGQMPQGYTPNFQYNPASDPGYQFRLNQGLQGVMNQNTALGGGLNSGNTLEALMNYGQGVAGQSYQQEFNNWLSQNSQAMSQQNQQFGQLYNMAGLGENAAAGVGNAGIQTGNQIASNITGAGNASAANSIAQGNVWGSAVQNAFSPGNVNSLLGYTQSPTAAGYSGQAANYGGSAGAGYYLP